MAKSGERPAVALSFRPAAFLCCRNWEARSVSDLIGGGDDDGVSVEAARWNVRGLRLG